MLEPLKFVMRSVARRDLVPGLSHFRITNGICVGFNGLTAIAAPVEIPFDCAPAAAAFIRALNACEDVITLTQESESRIIVRSGNFTTAVPCIPLGEVPVTLPEGQVMRPPQSMLKAFEVLTPFIGNDASRSWACGVMLEGMSAHATNNIVLAEYWLGAESPFRVNVPSSAVEEVVRIGEELQSVQLSENSITFHYPGGRWVKSQLMTLEWPNMLAVFDKNWSAEGMKPVLPGLVSACEKLALFGDKKDCRIYFRESDVATTLQGTLENGAVVILPGLTGRGCFHTRFLLDVLRVARGINIDKYPEMVPFYGDHLRGGIIGIRY